MHDNRGNHYTLLMWALYSLVWLVITALVTELMRQQGFVLWQAELVAVAYCLPLGVFAGAARYLCLVMPLGGQNIRTLLGVHLGGAVFSSAIWTVAYIVLFRLLSVFDNSVVYQVLWILFISGVIGYIVSILYHYLVIAKRRERLTEKRINEMELLSREAELRAIRMQVEPHFLFNSLNSIVALIDIDPQGARQMVLRLSDFFRAALDARDVKFVTLKDELKFIDNYLEIESVRFGERMRLHQEIAPRLLGVKMPPLLLQPLVENAVKHGVADALDPVEIAIDARADGEMMLFRISNNYEMTNSKKKKGTGVGLHATAARIDKFYRGLAVMDVSAKNGIYTVELFLPIHLPSSTQRGEIEKA